MDTKKTVIDPMIFWPTLLVIVGVTIPAIINPEAAGFFLDNLLLFITGKFGWLYLVFGLGSVIFLVWLALGKYGKNCSW